MLTRRTLLFGTVLGTTLIAAGGDFWDKKPPAQWTPEEIDDLITKSPWAKQVHAEYLSGPITGCSGGPGVWSDQPPLPRVGMPPGTMGLPRPDIGGRAPKNVKSGYVATVRWESAQPILLALKAKLTDVFQNHYVISVTGLPNTASSDCKASTSGDDLKNLKEFATLRTKSNDAVRADVVERQVSASSNLLFGFPKAKFPLTVETKEVEFACHIDQLSVKAKFNTKEMLYSGQLAL